MALLGLWGFLLLGRQPPAASVGGVPSARARELETESPPRLSRLKLELLDLPREPYSPETKSIFGVRPPPPPPPPVRPVEIARPAPPPPDPFQEAAKQLRFVGFLQTGEGPTALISQGTDLHIVAVGETVAARFQVQSVTEEGVVLTSPDGDKHVRLVLKEAPPPGAPGPKR